MRPRPRTVVFRAAAALAIALAATVILGCSSGQSSSPGGRTAGGSSNASAPGASGFDGAALPGDVPAPDFTLVDQQGQRVSLSQYRGQVTVLAFMYSTCGAPCIVIAQQIRGALDELARPAVVVIVSADPAADTTSSVARFLNRVSLSGRVRYLTGRVSRLRPVWRAYRVVPASAGRAAFARAATVALVDRRGRERVLFGPEQLTPESLAHDVRRLQTG